MLSLIDLLNYLPNYLKEYKTLSDILNVQSNILNQMEKDLIFLLENSFVLTAGSYGLQRFEDMLNIKSYISDSDEIRRQRILAKLDTKAPYTIEMLKNKIESIVGENYTFDINYEEYVINIVTNIIDAKQVNIIGQIIDEYVPVNVLLNAISKLYNEKNMHFFIAGGIVVTKKYKLK